MHLQLCLILGFCLSVCLSSHDSSDIIVDPCRFLKCPFGSECRLKRQGRMCVNPPCTPRATCLPVGQSTSRCPIGLPVVGRYGRDIRCSARIPCPESTSCDTSFRGRSKCCLQGLPEYTWQKPGVCPRPRFGRPGICVQRCSNDYSCPGRQKCCSNGCGQTCRWPLNHLHNNRKPGMCPRWWSGRHVHGLRCGRPCSIDNDCIGRRKCCGSRRCGRTCRRPVTTRPLCPFGSRSCSWARPRF